MLSFIYLCYRLFIKKYFAKVQINSDLSNIIPSKEVSWANKKGVNEMFTPFMQYISFVIQSSLLLE